MNMDKIALCLAIIALVMSLGNYVGTRVQEAKSSAIKPVAGWSHLATMAENAVIVVDIPEQAKSYQNRMIGCNTGEIWISCRAEPDKDRDIHLYTGQEMYGEFPWMTRIYIKAGKAGAHVLVQAY